MFTKSLIWRERMLLLRSHRIWNGSRIMTKLILATAVLAMAASGANACDFARSAAAKVDNMTVASTATTQSMAATELASPTDRRVKDDVVDRNG